MLKKLISKLRFGAGKKDNFFLKNKTTKKSYSKAFVHKSFNEKEHNERLEFLGDSVLSLIVSEILFHENKKKGEGFLSKKRSRIVSRKHLNMVGKKLIPDIRIKSTLKKIPPNIFGNTLEAIIGAIYLEKGLKDAKKFVKKHIYTPIYFNRFTDTDFKSEVLKICQKKGFLVEFKIYKQTGEEHKKVFTIDLYINKKQEARGEGRSIKEAEQIASEKAINKLFLHI